MDDKFKPRRRRGREERLEERREARTAQKLANRREIEKQREAGYFMLVANCAFCGEGVEAHEAVNVGGYSSACPYCIKSYGKEVIEGYVAAHPEEFKGSGWCPGCSKRQDVNDFNPFWTGKNYVAICKTCTRTRGETELRDKVLKQRGTEPIMDGGLPTLGKDR